MKVKDELTSAGIKSRKLSTSNCDSRPVGLVPNNDKKAIGVSMLAGSSASETCSVNSASISKVKKTEEEVIESFKRKSTSRKMRDDDKSTNNSSEMQMYE